MGYLRLSTILQNGSDADALSQMGILMIEKNDLDAAAVYFRKTIEVRFQMHVDVVRTLQPSCPCLGEKRP